MFCTLSILFVVVSEMLCYAGLWCFLLRCALLFVVLYCIRLGSVFFLFNFVALWLCNVVVSYCVMLCCVVLCCVAWGTSQGCMAVLRALRCRVPDEGLLIQPSCVLGLNLPSCVLGLYLPSWVLGLSLPSCVLSLNLACCVLLLKLRYCVVLFWRTDRAPMLCCV